MRANLSLLLAAAIHHVASFPEFCEAIRARRRACFRWSRTVSARPSVESVRCSEQCGQQTPRKSSSVTRFCATCSRHGSSWRCSVPWTSLFSTKKCGQTLAAIPLRAKMSSKTMDVLVATHVEDSSFYKFRWAALTNAHKPLQRYAASSAEDKGEHTISRN